MAQFVVKNKTFVIPEGRLNSYPDSFLAIAWKWREIGEDSVDVGDIDPSEFQVIVNFYLTGKWPNYYLKNNRLPIVSINGQKVDATDYFLLPCDDNHIDWSVDEAGSPESPKVTGWSPAHFKDRDYERGDYKDRDCLWGERLFQEKMRREDERAEWAEMEEFMDRFW